MGVHAVLGADGAIGQATVAALKSKGMEVKLLTRADADATKVEDLLKVLPRSSVVYDCVGLPYSSDVWASGFPAISRALVEACENVGAKIVYFDNVYMYGPAPLPVPFDENTHHAPPSRKGKARKAALDILIDAHHAGRVQVTVGRSADFYGPAAVNSPYYIKFLENMLKGNAPQVAMPEGPVHTYAYTEDMGRALVELALDEGACGEEFHLPVGPPVKVSEMAALFNKELGRSFSVSHVPDALLRILSLFNPLVREVHEMNYQYRTDYVMSDQKFRQRYPDFAHTPYAEGVAAMVEHFAR